MRISAGAAIDGRLERLIIGHARREWPLLRLVPAALMGPVVAPVARRIRRSLAHTTLVLVVALAVIAGVLALAPLLPLPD
jgi:hypothetical protein